MPALATPSPFLVAALAVDDNESAKAAHGGDNRKSLFQFVLLPLVSLTGTYNRELDSPMVFRRMNTPTEAAFLGMFS